MLDESANDRASSVPSKQGRKGSRGLQKSKSARSRANASDQQSDTSLKNNSLSKSKRASLPVAPQKGSNVSDGTFAVKVDGSTIRVTINGDSRIFGTDNVDSNSELTGQVLEVVRRGREDDWQNFKWALSTVHGIGPKDELEGLLAAQMIGVHNLAMECLKRASLQGQTFEGMDANVNRAVRLLRTFTSQMEALNRHRGKVGQQMVVGNVNVNDGGQAIVGPVSPAGRRKALTEDEDKSE